MRPTTKQMILGLCVFSLSLIVIACSPKTKDAKESITVNTRLASVSTNEDKAIPKYDHIFVIIEENKSYDQIIGNPSAPIINQLAKTYGLAANFYAEVHPSEANYIAMLGGDTFGIHDDDAFYCQAGSSEDNRCGN
jgi:phosphatidylinositol-3-phosphatase